MSKRRKRKTNTSIFIACEGSKTEPIYFEAINEDIEDEGDIVVTIYPDQNVENPKTDAIGLVEEAQSRMDDFDEVWVVIDKDGYTQHKEAFELAATPIDGKIVNIAFSSISFEHWILLHFEKNSNAFTKSADVIQYLIDNNFFTAYQKNINIYSSLKNKTETAIENAAWLRRQQESTLTVNGNLIFNINPITNVDKLVKRLFGNNTELSVRELDNLYYKLSGKFQFQVTKNETTFGITLTNEGSTSLIFNSQNISNYFRLTDEQENQIEVSISNNVLITPNERKTFNIAPIQMVENGKLSFSLGNEKVLIFI